MSVTALRPWDTYAASLSALGHGYALWNPDPGVNGEVHIGDVGYIENGHFVRVFNAIRTAHDELNRNGVPEGFAPLEVDGGLKVTDKHALPAGALCTPGVSANWDPKGRRPEIGLKCTSNEGGAAVILKDPALSEELPPTRAMPAYMRANYATWIALAQKRGLKHVARDDLVFVRGTVKTSAWAVVAFDESAADSSITFSGSFSGPQGTAFSAGNATSKGKVEFGAGPVGQPHRRSSTLGALGKTLLGKSPVKRDQCIFIQYYKIKASASPKMKARSDSVSEVSTLPSKPPKQRRAMTAQEPLSPRNGNVAAPEANGKPLPAVPKIQNVMTTGYNGKNGKHANGDRQLSTSGSPHVDPVDVLLDFILANSSAQIAIATQIPPDDFRRLSSRGLHVRIDKGLGTLAYTPTYLSLSLRPATDYLYRLLPAEDPIDDLLITDNLALLHTASFAESRASDDLDAAVQWNKFAVDRRHPGRDARRALIQFNLACLLRIRYDRRRSNQDLEEAVAFARDGFAAAPGAPVIRQKMLTTLVALLEERCRGGQRKKDAADLARYKDELAGTKAPADEGADDPLYAMIFAESWASPAATGSAHNLNTRQIGALLALLGAPPSEIRLKDAAAYLEQRVGGGRDLFLTLIRGARHLCGAELSAAAAAVRCLTAPPALEGEEAVDRLAGRIIDRAERAAQARHKTEPSV